MVAGKSPAQTGMLFRLHPEEIKCNAEKERESATTTDTTTTPDTTNTQTETPVTLAQYLPTIIFAAVAGMFLYVLVSK